MLTNDVIIIQFSAGTLNKITYKTYISDFSPVEKWQNNIILLLIYDMTVVHYLQAGSRSCHLTDSTEAVKA